MEYLRGLYNQVLDAIGKWYFYNVMTPEQQKVTLNRASQKVFGQDWVDDDANKDS